jgi:GAF domain-containing protein
MDRYEGLATAFVGLADTLVADYDVVELAQQLVDNSMHLLPIAAAGILVGDAKGHLHVLASSSEHSRLLELFQVETGAGPCLEAYRTAQQVLIDDLALNLQQWPAFAERAVEYGFRSVAALPMRLRDERVGALNLFRSESSRMANTDIAVAQALADVATIGILHQRILTRSELINQQLQTALNSRVMIEQAKGVLSERGGIDMNRAFNLLRQHAHVTNQRLADLAAAVVGGADSSAILDH